MKDSTEIDGGFRMIATEAITLSDEQEALLASFPTWDEDRPRSVRINLWSGNLAMTDIAIIEYPWAWNGDKLEFFVQPDWQTTGFRLWEMAMRHGRHKAALKLAEAVHEYLEEQNKAALGAPR